jgi:hypothetical protein
MLGNEIDRGVAGRPGRLFQDSIAMQIRWIEIKKKTVVLVKTGIIF